MQIYLFTIDGKPGCRTTLHEAQACLEDHFRDQRNVSDVWWDDKDPYVCRKYMYGSSHSDTVAEGDPGYDEVDFETTEQIIWPVSLPDGEYVQSKRMDPPFGGAELILTVRTGEEQGQLIRTIPKLEWIGVHCRSHLILDFAVNAGQALADHWKMKERT